MKVGAMRTFLPFIAVTLALAARADAATRNFGVSGFDRIRVEGPFKVSLATGVAPFAKASGGSPAALDSVTIDVQGRTLVVRSNRTKYGDVDRILEALPRERMLGVVLNQSDDVLTESHYNYGYYGKNFKES